MVFLSLISFLSFFVSATSRTGERYSVKPLHSNWNPFVVNGSCPIFVLSTSGDNGIGDQLEHYIYSLTVCKLLGGTILLEGYNENNNHGFHHKEYQEVFFDILGLPPATPYNSSLKKETLSFMQVVEKHKKIISGKEQAQKLCGTIIESSIMSCNKGSTEDVHNAWCLNGQINHPIEFTREIIWFLRNNTARDKCFARKNIKGSSIDTSSSSSCNGSTPAIQIVWHIRTGDLCLHCDQAYFIRTFANIRAALAPNNRFEAYRDDGGKDHCPTARLHFETVTTKELKYILELFPFATMSVGGSVVATVCRFLTADILVGSGSSFVTSVAAFAPPLKPLLFEEKRHSLVVPRGDFQHHVFGQDQAVLMVDGNFQLSLPEVQLFVRHALGSA